MKDIEQFISPIIESQFPAVYREEGPVFVTFVKAYYEWLESTGNALYYTRKLPSLRDVDETVDSFLVYFKEQFLKNIQFDVATNKRLLIKNSLDLYRSKGTPRAIELFFKLVYAQPAKVYYPGGDLMRLSDGTWKKPVYLEVADTPYNDSYTNKQITGINSGATAFVDTIATTKRLNNFVDATGKKVKVSKDIHIFYLSNLKGSFQFNEKITHSDITDLTNTTKVVGSLNDLVVVSGSSGYVVGDTVTLSSITGYKGKAIVSAISNTTGQVDFILIDGGWGFTTSPDILVSERVFTVNNIITTSNNLTTPFTYFEDLTQPKANIQFTPLTGSFAANDYVYSYANSTSGLTGLGQIISIQSNSTQANIYVTVASGNLQSNSTFYNSINSVSGQILTFTDLTATANLIAVSTRNQIFVTGISSSYSVDQEIYQSNSSIGEYANGIIDNVSATGANAYLTLSNVRGVFIPGDTVTSRLTGVTSTLNYYTTDIGIIDTSTTSVRSVSVVSGGSGYSNSDIVQFTSDTGRGATARIVTDSSGVIVSAVIKRAGSGYLTAPVVSIDSTSSSFNFNANTDISTTDNFITLLNHDFINSQAIVYNVGAGNTALTGLVSGTTYYVRSSNTSGISISTTPKGTTISLVKGLSETGHTFTSVVSSGVGASLTASLGSAFDYINSAYVRGSTSNSSGLVTKVSKGSSATFRVGSLNDEEPVEFYTDFINDVNMYGASYLDIRVDASSNSALSGSNAYGFPAYPSANSTTGAIGDIFAVDSATIGSIASISITNPGSEYNTDPLVTIVEPNVYKNRRPDYLIALSGSNDGFSLDENLQYIGRRRFDGKNSVGVDYITIDQNYFVNNNIVTYTVDTGVSAVGGLSALEGLNTYYVVQANSSQLKLSATQGGSAITLTATATSSTGHYLQDGSYSGFAILKEKVESDTIRAMRTSLFTDLPKIGDIYIKGETSGDIQLVSEYSPDNTYSGFNASVEANVVTADGYVKTLRVVDSGFGYSNFETVSFTREGDKDSIPGTARVITRKQGTGEGFYQDTGSFLSGDKYLHDGDYYQEYSYDVVTKVPFERYSEMLKKVLHVAGTKAFHSVEIESTVKNTVNISSDITIQP